MNPEKTFTDAMKKYEEAYRSMLPLEENYKDINSQTRSIKAKAFVRAKGNNQEREMQSEFHPEVMKQLLAVHASFILYNRARADKEIQEKRWETSRSLISLEKAKMNLT